MPPATAAVEQERGRRRAKEEEDRVDAAKRCDAEGSRQRGTGRAEEQRTGSLVEENVAVRDHAVTKRQGHVVPCGRVENDGSFEGVKAQEVRAGETQDQEGLDPPPIETRHEPTSMPEALRTAKRLSSSPAVVSKMRA